MLTAFTLAAALFQTTAGVVWESPAPRPDPVVAEAPADAPPAPATALPDWALTDPFGWERSQCSPLIRGATPLETCQSRARSELFSALGDRLPAGLRPSGDPVPCQATPDANGAYPLQCGAPERAGVQVVSVPQARDCRPRPTSEGGRAVSFTNDCRSDTAGREDGLKIRLFGND
jgi:hypothetical protein